MYSRPPTPFIYKPSTMEPISAGYGTIISSHQPFNSTSILPHDLSATIALARKQFSEAAAINKWLEFVCVFYLYLCIKHLHIIRLMYIWFAVTPCVYLSCQVELFLENCLALIYCRGVRLILHLPTPLKYNIPNPKPSSGCRPFFHSIWRTIFSIPTGWMSYFKMMTFF